MIDVSNLVPDYIDDREQNISTTYSLPSDVSCRFNHDIILLWSDRGSYENGDKYNIVTCMACDSKTLTILHEKSKVS